MECVILYRNTQTGFVGFVTNDDGELEVFEHRDAAIFAIEHTTVCKVFPCQIVELDEI